MTYITLIILRFQKKIVVELLILNSIFVDYLIGCRVARFWYAMLVKCQYYYNLGFRFDKKSFNLHCALALTIDNFCNFRRKIFRWCQQTELQAEQLLAVDALPFQQRYFTILLIKLTSLVKIFFVWKDDYSLKFIIQLNFRTGDSSDTQKILATVFVAKSFGKNLHQTSGWNWQLLCTALS